MKKKKIRISAKKITKNTKITKKPIKKVVKVVKATTVNKKNKSTRKSTPVKPVVLRETLISGKRPNEIQLLEQFFDGPVRLKLWKVFSLNSTKEFTLKDLTRLTKTKSEVLIINIREMMKQGIIQGVKKEGIVQNHKEMVIAYSIIKNFPLLPEITQLILTAIPRSSEKVLAELLSLQRLKMVLLSGFFTSKLGLSTPLFSATQSSIDLLLIFEKIPTNVTEVIAELEHKLGRDLRYAALDQEDFKYRHSIGDKLIRDVLDFDHVVAMDKLAFFR